MVSNLTTKVRQAALPPTSSSSAPAHSCSFPSCRPSTSPTRSLPTSSSLSSRTSLVSSALVQLEGRVLELTRSRDLSQLPSSGSAATRPSLWSASSTRLTSSTLDQVRCVAETPAVTPADLESFPQARRASSSGRLSRLSRPSLALPTTTRSSRPSSPRARSKPARPSTRLDSRTRTRESTPAPPSHQLADLALSHNSSGQQTSRGAVHGGR